MAITYSHWKENEKYVIGKVMVIKNVMHRMTLNRTCLVKRTFELRMTKCLPSVFPCYPWWCILFFFVFFFFCFWMNQSFYNQTQNKYTSRKRRRPTKHLISNSQNKHQTESNYIKATTSIKPKAAYQEEIS
jgi:hypothetical protein